MGYGILRQGVTPTAVRGSKLPHSFAFSSDLRFCLTAATERADNPRIRG
jgi:hypothetical protein